LSPIIFLIPAVILTGVTGERFDFAGIHPDFIMGIACLFLMMSAFYVMLCDRKRMSAALSVSGLTNGVMLIFLSTSFGSGMIFNILGFAAIIAGALNTMTQVVPAGETLFVRRTDRIMPNTMSVDELKPIIDSIQFPCVFMEKDTNGGERIIAHNAAFLEHFRFSGESVAGKSLESLLPLDSARGKMRFEGEEWVVKRTVKGRQVLLMLSPVLKSGEASKIEIFDAIDQSTGLYVEGFMKYKARSDVESVRRGKRKLSAILFKMSFPSNAILEVREDERKLAYVVVARQILQSIRACDSAYRTADDEALLLMPDTNTAGTDVVISRICAALKRASPVECPGLSKIMLDYASKDYIGGMDLPAYDKILEELSVTLYRKNPELAVAASL
jgi:GGDEF domain-containing protein